MIKKRYTTKHLTLIVCLLFSVFIYAQNNKQSALENRRQELQKEIKKIAKLRLENKTKAQSELSLIEDFNYKIKVLNNLIKVTNQQANLLTKSISNNKKRIKNLESELSQLKKNYATMIVKSYKSKNKQSRVMFLLSSDNFKQAYKRLQYLKQYTDYQKKQGEAIKVKTNTLKEVNNTLLEQKKDKQKLIAENKVTQKALENERGKHNKLMATIKKNLSRYTAQIKKKQQETAKIDRQIKESIRAAIPKSRAKSSKTKKATNIEGFALTAEEKVLASNFTSNKGKLPWPVEKGLVKLRYGKQPSPIDKHLTINSNGVRIATEKGAEARAVFDGEVSEILKMKNVNPIVMIRHGNYLTVYRNLAKVYVRKGDKVKTKQAIGEVFTNPSNGETILRFTLSKGTATENPASWIYKM